MNAYLERLRGALRGVDESEVREIVQ